MNVIPILAQATNKAAEVAADKTEELKTAATQLDAAAEPGFFYELIHSGALGFLIEGGLFMWPILLLGILALAVIIERWRSLKMLNADSSEMRNMVIDLLTNDKVEEALTYTDSKRGPVAAILSNGLRKYVVLRRLNYDPARIEEQVVKSMENYGVHIVAALERHLPVLAITSSVAPMLGFLGTVQGMIVSFKNIVDTMGEVNIVEAAASGIQVALLTTCFGLIIGIPAFMAFNYFSSVINGFVLEVEETAQELMEVVTLQITLEQQTHEA
ncbi:MAG: biopolymer transport protein ExbB [Kiritimatiellia bacterium]|jgi:biopolymer transport protein ExbB